MSIEAGWLKRTFNTRDRTETLLRPDFESGLITQHDYNLAVSFLPGPQRYYPYINGAGCTLLAAAYLRFQRKMPLTNPRFGPVCTLSYLAGHVVGLGMFVTAHKTFVAQLEERERFFQALKNVWMRTEGRGDEVGLQSARTDINGNAIGTGEGGMWAPDQAQTANPPAPPPSVQGSTPSATSKPPSRWDEIRVANSRNARTSSWDALRQQHERTSATDNVQTPNDPESERAQEQARFDALLEAERNLGRN